MNIGVVYNDSDAFYKNSGHIFNSYTLNKTPWDLSSTSPHINLTI
jgi:hypothetical protein